MNHEDGIPKYTGQSPKPDERPKLKQDSLPVLKPDAKKAAPPETVPELPPNLSPEEIRANRLEALAQKHSSAIAPISPAQLVTDIYTVCQFMQRVKPYNADLSSLDVLAKHDGIELKTYWMKHDELSNQITEGIIFFTAGSGGSRRRPSYYGWGLNKNPMLRAEKIGKEVWKWEQTWLENYGYLNPAIADEIKARIAAIEEANVRVVTRRHSYDWLENRSTFEIAQMWAVSHMMAFWFFHQRMADWGDESGDILAWLKAIWLEQAQIMERELEYRTEAEPKPLSSKKKTEAKKADFRKAAEILAGSVKGLYAQDFIDMVTKTQFPFDFSLDPEAIPKQKPEKEPVMRMNSSKLMAEFMRWVTDAQIDPDSFEAEDALVLKLRVQKALVAALEDERKALARAKGQKVETSIQATGKEADNA